MTIPTTAKEKAQIAKSFLNLHSPVFRGLMLEQTSLAQVYDNLNAGYYGHVKTIVDSGGTYEYYKIPAFQSVTGYAIGFDFNHRAE